jgi:SAM-dependent methyltransferase
MADYGALESEFYELDKPEAPPDALDFYADFAREARGPIHEPMCGNGRFLLPLLAEGLEVSGSDSSSHMLAACARRATELGLRPELSLQSIETLSCVRAPRLLIIPSGSFGLLIDDAPVRAALQRLHEVLAPGGVLLVEAERLLQTIPESSGVWGGRWVERGDGAKLLFSWLVQYSGAANVTTSLHRYELIEGGRPMATEYRDFRVRSYGLEEFRSLLAAAGFIQIEALKPYARMPIEGDDDAIVFLARKA